MSLVGLETGETDFGTYFVKQSSVTQKMLRMKKWVRIQFFICQNLVSPKGIHSTVGCPGQGLLVALQGKQEEKGPTRPEALKQDAPRRLQA